MKKYYKYSALIMVMVLLLMTSACGNPGSQTGSTTQNGVQDTLKVAFRNEPGNLDPLANQSLTAFALENMIFDRLVYKNPEGKIEPMLATKWEIVDDTTIRFYLRQDAVFHNGDKVTAEDVKYTIERAEGAATSKSYFKYFDGQNTKVVDPYTIDVKMYNAFAPALNYLASPRGSILPKKYLEEVGPEAFGRKPVGSGKMAFKEWVSGDHITLETNEKYWGNKPAFKTMLARIITDATSRAIELETSGADVALHISSADIKRLNSNEQTQVLIGPSYQTIYMYFDTIHNDTYDDIRVRKALSLAIDMNSAVKAAYGETASVADSIMSPQVFGYKSVGPNTYDPKQAKALLDEANFDYSKPLNLTVADDTSYIQVAEALQNMWHSIGVDVKINIMDTATLVSTGADGSGSIPFRLNSTNAATGDPDHALGEWKKEPRNVMGMDEEFYSLIDKGAAEYDETERAKVYEEIQKRAWDSYMSIPIAFNKVVYGVRSNVNNMPVDPGACPDFSLITFK